MLMSYSEIVEGLLGLINDLEVAKSHKNDSDKLAIDQALICEHYGMDLDLTTIDFDA